MAEAKSTRKQDAKVEILMQQHYNRVYNAYGYTYRRCYDSYKQRKGEDLSVNCIDGKYHIVDEKCAIYYWDKELNTYSFELSFELCDRSTGLSTGKVVDGWFVNPDVITEYYSLGYIKATSRENVNKGKLTVFENIFISKKKIANYLNELFNTKDLIEVENQFLDKVDDGELRKTSNGRYVWAINDDVRLVWSTNLAERPINIVISKKILSELAEKHCIITYTGNGDEFKLNIM